MVRTMRQLGFMMTGGSSSVRDLWEAMRHAAAMARATVVGALAADWAVPAAGIVVADGVFSHATGRRITLGEAVRQFGASWKPAGTWALKDPSRFKVIGKPLPHVEGAAKVAGTAVFGIDVQRPGMLYAALRLCPTRGGAVRTFDATKARALTGVRHVVSVPPLHGGTGGVAVVADRWWRVRQALEALEVEWDAGPMAGVSSQAVLERLARELDSQDGYGFWTIGDVDAALAAAPKKLAAEYRAPYLAHATLEPMNCTIEFDGRKARLWVPTQVPGFARRAAANALGVDADQVEVEVTLLGGGFGRRLETDFVAQAAAIARQVPGVPIQVLWSREDDTRHDFYRPACVSRFAAGLGADGRVVAWRNTSAGQAPTLQYLPRNSGLPIFGPDKTTSEGSYDVAYEFPAVRVGHVAVDLPVPVGYWRAVGHSHQAFFKESFLDECAHAAGADPYRYRAALLERHPRPRAVLELAATKAGWGTPLGPAADGAPRARGIALHESFGSTVAQVVEVSIGAQREIRVHRVVCAIDCGLPVNPNLIAQQMESGIVFGLTAALHGDVAIEDGRVKPGNFHEYPLLRLTECPAIETHIVPSTAAPEGVGEPGQPPIAPAVANAVFVLTGQRLRTMPLRLAT
jgi:isoquinoline 1-oxidoreductase beta subunit